MLTIIRLKNLLIYWLLFKFNDDNTKIMCGSAPSYISSKYDLFFNDIPEFNKIKDLDKNNIVLLYCNKWNLIQKDFIETDEYKKWLFTTYIVNSLKKKKNTINLLLNNFNLFFDNYNVINNKSVLINTLHMNIRRIFYFVISENRIQIRNLFIHSLIQKNID